MIVTNKDVEMKISFKEVLATLFIGVLVVCFALYQCNKANGTWKEIEMEVTAYCPCVKCCEQFADGITASGHKIKQGDRFVAADKRYPFHTKMIIKGYNDNNPVKVLDRGGAIKGDRIDVFFDTHQEALNWGRKKNHRVLIAKGNNND